MSNLKKDLGPEDLISVSMTAISDDLRFRPNGVDPDDPVFAGSGLNGGEALFKPGEIEQGNGYGAGIPIDFREVRWVYTTFVSKPEC